ncbi:9684_t:CDS:2 [Funneliformis geosporum]|nr:9684_t:CDS:2 [Funneliformis geosporum]
MALPKLLRDIATAINCVELYIDRDRSFDPKNTLNGIQITLITVYAHRTHIKLVYESQYCEKNNLHSKVIFEALVS